MQLTYHWKAKHTPSGKYLEAYVNTTDMLRITDAGSKWHQVKLLTDLLDSGKYHYVRGEIVTPFEREDFVLEQYRTELIKSVRSDEPENLVTSRKSSILDGLTNEELGGLLFGIHEHDKVTEEIVYPEKRLLPILKALGLPAPKWGKAYTVGELRLLRKKKR